MTQDNYIATTPFIKREELKIFFSLNDEELNSLLATFGIQSDKQLTENTIKGMFSFLKRTKDIKDIDIKKLNFNNHHIPNDINLEEQIKNRQLSKRLPKKVETKEPKNKQIEIKEDSIVPKVAVSTKSPKLKISKPEIKKSIKLPQEENIPPKEEITGIIGKKENLIETAKKRDKTKLVNSSFMRTRYDLYLDDCKKNDVNPVGIDIYKTIKGYPIESSFIFDKSLKNTVLVSNGIRKIFGPKNASKIFNSGFKVYYTKLFADISILCQLDITKPFATNLNSVTNSKYKYGFDFYTKCEKFDTSLIERVVTITSTNWSKEDDEKILAFYNSKDYADANKKIKNNSTTLKELAKSFGVDPSTIRSRAIELGFINFKKPKDTDWSEAELKLLDSCIGKYNPKKISKIFKENGFTRGHIGIGIKITRLGLSRKLNGSEELNLKMLSDAMGVDSHFFYDNNRLEKLNARKEDNNLIFERKNIAIYLKENPYDYSLTKVDPKWFVDILTSNFQGA